MESKLEVIDHQPHLLGEVGVHSRGGWRDNNEVERKLEVIHPWNLLVGRDRTRTHRDGEDNR